MWAREDANYSSKKFEFDVWSNPSRSWVAEQNTDRVHFTTTQEGRGIPKCWRLVLVWKKSSRSERFFFFFNRSVAHHLNYFQDRAKNWKKCEEMSAGSTTRPMGAPSSNIPTSSTLRPARPPRSDGSSTPSPGTPFPSPPPSTIGRQAMNNSSLANRPTSPAPKRVAQPPIKIYNPTNNNNINQNNNGNNNMNNNRTPNPNNVRNNTTVVSNANNNNTTNTASNTNNLSNTNGVPSQKTAIPPSSSNPPKPNNPSNSTNKSNGNRAAYGKSTGVFVNHSVNWFNIYYFSNMDIPCTNYYNRVCIHPVGVMHHMSRLLSVEEIEELNAELE